MEPYLNRMSALANTQSGCGSSRKNLYQPNHTPITTTTPITPSHVMILRRRCATRCALSMDCSLQLIERHQTVRSAGTIAAALPLTLMACCSVWGPFACCASALKCLQILHQRILFLSVQLSSETLAFMPGVTVTRRPDIQLEILASAFLGDVGHEPNLRRVVHV